MNLIYSGVAILYGNSVMLCKRQLNCHFGGYWSVPCGAVEAGESSFGAAQRELKEETQIELSERSLRYATSFKAHDGGRFNLYTYESPDLLFPVLDGEHTEWGYFSLDAIEDLHISSALLQALVKIREKSLDC